MNSEIKISLHRVMLILIAVITSETLGYTLIERQPIFDSLYMTIITITITGHGEARSYLWWGIERKEERRKRLLNGMENHYIMCGFGKGSYEVARRLPQEYLVIIE